MNDQMENITLRRRLSLRSNSSEVMDVTDFSPSNAELDCTAKSLDLSNLDQHGSQDIKDELSTLKTLLSSTQNKLANVIIENTELKNEIYRLNKQLLTFKELNTNTPISSAKPNTSLKRRMRRKRLSSSYNNVSIDNSADESTERNSQDTMGPQEHVTSENKLKATTEIHVNNDMGVKIGEINKNTKEKEASTKSLNPKEVPSVRYSEKGHVNQDALQKQNKTLVRNNTIHILGEQHVIGLSHYINEKRFQKWNDNYKVMSFIKPNALACESLKNCSTLKYDLKHKDIVVLAVGANDKNPCALLNELAIALDKLRNARVYVLQVYSNEYLRTNTINSHIECLVKLHKNCRFIKSNKKHYYIQDYLNDMTYKINFNIDYNDYYDTYLTFNKNKITPIPKKLANNEQNNDMTKPNKNKITYYFKPKISNNECEQNTSEPLVHTTPKKGTIPYYFQKKILNKKDYQQDFFR